MLPASVATKTVLIADDTAFVRERFETALQDAGHRAVAVKSAAELLARVRADQDQLDLLVIDLRLPHTSGVDLVRAVRKIDSGRLPILVFSGTISSAEEVRALPRALVQYSPKRRELNLELRDFLYQNLYYNPVVDEPHIRARRILEELYSMAVSASTQSLVTDRAPAAFVSTYFVPVGVCVYRNSCVWLHIGVESWVE
jgi:CheY-like chemotaxis protein